MEREHGYYVEQKMRISDNEKRDIVNAISEIDNEASIWLFGSRTDDKKRGGDIDIAVLSKKSELWKKYGLNDLSVIKSANKRSTCLYRIAGMKLSSNSPLKKD